RAEFTNFVCTSMNKDFADFDYCVLKAVNRTYKYVSMKLTLYEKPLKSLRVNFALYKRANGYKPFLYNQTVDGCKFFKNPKSNIVTQYFFGFIKEITNLSHPCPYNEDFTMEKLSLEMVNYRITNLLPFPEGEYMFQAIWTGNNKGSVVFKLYIQLTN
ncbi:hypothetical protein KR200_004290, partial [Drosophila serrata]